MKKEKVYLVGAGPGKPDLITVRGLNVLKQADVVIYDYLVDKRIFKYLSPDTLLICCGRLAKKGEFLGSDKIDQDKINKLIVDYALTGKKVARLKNGDPSIFSRISQELEALASNGIEFEIIPGVTAASAASAYTGIPLTERSLSSTCVFLTGQEDIRHKKSFIDWKALAKSGTIVLYMSVNSLEESVKNLIVAGKKPNTKVAIIQDISRLTQKLLIGNLSNIVALAKENKLKAPAIIIVGPVVGMEKKYNWFKKNRSILFTGLSDQRFFLKGTYEHLPLIKIELLDDYTDFDKRVEKISDYDWLVFTSRYGVRCFFTRLKALNYDNRKLYRLKAAVVGESTFKALKHRGILADLRPQKDSAKGLIEAFKKVDLKGKKVFLPRSDISDKGLELALKKQGAKIISSVAYKNVMPCDLPDLILDSFKEFMFTSPSTVRNFIKRYKALPQKARVSCIGQVTAKEAKRCKLLN